MNNYQDKYSRFHHKPCLNGEPSSGNAWLYTAYADKLELDLDKDAIRECFFKHCHIMNSDRNPTLLRNPGGTGSPFSRDEYLGCTYLGFLRNYQTFYNWNFSPYAIPKFSPLKLLKQLWQLRPSFLANKYITLFQFFGGKSLKLPFGYNLAFKHRNFFWENQLDQLYRFAFNVPVQDRYFILQKWGKFQWFNPAHIFYAAIAQIDKTGTASGIRFLKYGGEKNKLAMIKEFPEDHPIRQRLGL